MKFLLISFCLSFPFYLFFFLCKISFIPPLKSSLCPFCPGPLLLTPRFPGYPLQANPALWVSTGSSEALPLTVELASFPARPLCGPPGPSVVAIAVGPHFCHLWINQQLFTESGSNLQIFPCSFIRLSANSDCFMFQSDGFITPPLSATPDSYQCGLYHDTGWAETSHSSSKTLFKKISYCVNTQRK